MSTHKSVMARTRRQPQSSFLVSFIFCCLFSGLLLSVAQALPVAWLRQVKPTVQVSSGGKEWQNARERTRLRFGDYVRAGQNGKTVIQFNNGTHFTLRNGSQMQLISPATGNKPLVVRVFGALSEVFVHARGGVEIRTAAGTAAVRGTQYLVRVSDETSTQVTVTEGQVAFYNPQGEVLINPGFQSQAKVGSGPSTPTAVDVSGLIQWTADVSALPIDIEIPYISSDRAVLRRALAQRETAVKESPADATAHGRLAEALYDLGEYSRAADQWTVASRLEPQNTQWLIGLAQARRAGGNAAGAIETLDETLRSSPNNVEARAALAMAHLSAGDSEKTLSTLGEAGANEPAFFGATRAVAALRTGNYSAAESAAEAVLSKNSEYSPALVVRSLALLGQGKTEEARSVATRATQVAPHSAQTQGVLSMVLFFAGETSDAARAANRAVENDPFSPFALFAQGRVMLAQGQLGDARDVLGQAVALSPDLPGLQESLGATYLRLDLPVKAESAYRLALQQSPGQPELHAGLGAALHGQGRIQDAEKEYRLALEKEPKNSTARIRLAQLLIEQGQLDAAHQELEKGVAETPERGLLWVQMSENSLYRERVQEALEYALKAVNLLPNSSLARYQLGRVYLEMDRVVQAETQFRRAVQLDSQNAKALYALGVVREKTQSGLWASALSPGSQALGSTGSALSLQNLQSPGAAERIQGISQDSSVVRSATRSYGDTEITGVVGQDGVREGEISHLHTDKDRRGVLALTAESRRSDGTPTNYDREFDRFGVIYGQKRRESPSGFWAIAQYERKKYILNEAEPVQDNQRIPRFLAGYNWETDDRSRTRVLVQASRKDYTIRLPDLAEQYENYEFDSLNAELRHDRKIGDKHLLNFGLFGGQRSREFNAYIPPIDVFGGELSSRGEVQLNSYGAYLRHEWMPDARWNLTGELLWQKFQYESKSRNVLDGIPFPTSYTVGRESNFLPKLVVSYRPNSNNSLRLRLRRIAASVEDFQLLRPTDGFWEYDDLAQPALFGVLIGKGSSAELEWEHTFSNASFLEVTLFSQKLDGANYEGWRGPEFIDNVHQHGARIGYEAQIGDNTSFFSRVYLNKAEADGEHLPQIPRFSAALGLQYLNRQGFFVQPLLTYQGSRKDDVTGREFDSATVFNFRFGKRWGLRSTAFVELLNAFDKEYSVGQQQQFRRQLRVGYTQRF